MSQCYRLQGYRVTQIPSFPWLWLVTEGRASSPTLTYPHQNLNLPPPPPPLAGGNKDEPVCIAECTWLSCQLKGQNAWESGQYWRGAQHCLPCCGSAIAKQLGSLNSRKLEVLKFCRMCTYELKCNRIGWLANIEQRLRSAFCIEQSACWTAHELSAFHGLCGCEMYAQAVQTGHAILMQEFITDLKHRIKGVWRDVGLVDPVVHNNKLTTYHFWFTLPFLVMTVCNIT